MEDNLTFTIHKTINEAIDDYKFRHGEDPAKIIMSLDAFRLCIKFVNFFVVPKTYSGIPVHVTHDSGVHVQLCEPEIISAKYREKI